MLGELYNASFGFALTAIEPLLLSIHARPHNCYITPTSRDIRSGAAILKRRKNVCSYLAVYVKRLKPKTCCK